MSESQTLKTMVHETAHSMLHNKEVNKEDILAPAKDRNTKEVEAEGVAFTVCSHFGIDTSEYTFGYIAGWSSGRDMKELKSSLDTIRRTASELITGIEEQLREIQRDREIMQEQSQEFILAVSNTERSHFDIASVRGMEGAELLDSLLAMKDADRENVEAYLESRGAWVTHLGDDRSEEVEEFHVDYIYDTDTHAITDVKYAMEMDRKANEPIKDSDVVLKIMYRENDGYEIDKITNMTREQAIDLAYKLAALDENEWDGNIQDFMEENGTEYVPIIVKDGRNSGMPEFFDIAVDLKAEEVTLEEELSGMEYAASIIHRLEHGKGVFSPDERNLIVNYGYKLDDYEKTKELADVLAYRIENEPANAALTVIDAQAEIDALPDGMIGLSEMHGYGYTWEEMLPLTKETALELFDRDLAVYQLHKDGSETLIEDKEQITGHEGIFGIEKSDWENERELRSMQAELAESGANKQAQLLYGSSDKYGIYQLKDNPELRDFHFAGIEALKSRGIIKDNLDAIKPENYNLVYVGELSELSKDFIRLQTQGDKLEALYEKFNIDHPADYKGHSLSVSDIVVLHENGKNSAHFVDSVGFTMLPDFLREMEGIKEQETDKAEKGLTNEEKQFLETDNAHLIAKKFLAWDEIEDLGYHLFKPVEKALFGDGLVSDYTIHDIARRMQGGEDIREELAKALTSGYERVMGVGENDAVAVFGRDAVTVTFGNAEKQISYEEMGTAFLGLMESEYKKIEQARAADEQEEEIEGNATSGHNVNLSAKQKDLKLETESKKETETELAFQIADRFISIQETDGGYDYSIMGADYKEIDGGVYDNPDVSIREALNNIVEDLKENPFDNGARGNISENDELIPIDYDGLMEKVEAADHIEPQAQGNAVENFKAKTNELFHEISEMNLAEIEEAVKRHVQAKIDEYVIQAEIIDVAVVGSRCRGLEREGSDLDVAVELSTNEREDDLFHAFNNCDGIHIGGIKVDINPITAQRTGTLENYLPQVEDYLEGVREAREKEPVSIFNIRINDEERWFKNTSGLDAVSYTHLTLRTKLEV